MSHTPFQGQLLKHRREELDLTLEALAGRIESSKSYIWELENKNCDPGGHKLFLLSRALGVSMEWFYGHDMMGDQYAAMIGARVLNAVMPHIAFDRVCPVFGFVKKEEGG